jgi:hypothetical protein
VPRCRDALVALALGATSAAAQATHRAGPLPRTTFGGELGVGSSMAGQYDVYSCAPRPGLSAGASIVRRVARVVVIEGNAAVHGSVRLGSCVVGVAEPSGPIGVFQPRNVVFERDPSRHVVAATIVRAGVETPREWSDGTVLRVTGGAGRMWGVDVPFRTLRVASLIGRGRVMSSVSLERWWFGLPVEGVTYGTRNGEALHEVRRLHAHGTTLRLGAEWSLGRR